MSSERKNPLYIDGNFLLGKIKEVDGDGSGLDADMLDGQHANSFERSREATSNISFSDAISKAKLSNYRFQSAIEYASSNIILAKNDRSSGVEYFAYPEGPVYSLWYLRLFENYYCGIIMSYVGELCAVLFSYSAGTYQVKQL